MGGHENTTFDGNIAKDVTREMAAMKTSRVRRVL